MKVKGIGELAFLLGFLLVLVFGIFPTSRWIQLTLLILGLIVGLLNITEKETTRFLIATIGLLLAMAAFQKPLEVAGVTDEFPFNHILGILINVSIFVAPAALVVALKEVYSLAIKK